MQNLPNILKLFILGAVSGLFGYLFVREPRVLIFIAGTWVIYTLLTQRERLLPTAPEIQRETLVADDDGYADISISIEEIMMKATTLAFIMLIVPLIPYFLIYDTDQFFETTFTLTNLILAVPALLVAIVAHEFIHAATWVLFGRFSWRYMSFGIDRKTLSPYAHAQVPMKASAYRIGAAMPGLLTGVLPAVVAFVTGNGAFMLLSAFLISAAVGDVYVLWIIKNVPPDALVKDHPSNAGCLVKVDTL